jgi:hypothetical protein
MTKPLVSLRNAGRFSFSFAPICRYGRVYTCYSQAFATSEAWQSRGTGGAAMPKLPRQKPSFCLFRYHNDVLSCVYRRYVNKLCIDCEAA